MKTLQAVFLPVLATLLFVADAVALDRDSDGLFDAIDAPTFDQTRTDIVALGAIQLEDLDGVNLLHPELDRLDLSRNKITSLEATDFQGLGLSQLFLFNNNIQSIEPYSFEGLNLLDLNLNGNSYSNLHLEGIAFDRLTHLGIDRDEIKKLFLDDAMLGLGSYIEVARETSAITDLSLVGMTFSDETPENLDGLLKHDNLAHVTTDQQLYESFKTDFDAFAANENNSLLIVDPSDCSRDGSIDAADLSCVRTLPRRDSILFELDALPGDIDGDGDVTFEDFKILSLNFGQQGNYGQGNLDMVGGIDFEDFKILAVNVGRKPLQISSAAAVPEPSASAVCIWLILLLTLRRSPKA